MQIKYLEASWPQAFVADRIQPLSGTMHAQTKRKACYDDEPWHQVNDEVWQKSRWQPVDDEVWQKCCNYVSMLRNLMKTIQEYLVLSDDYLHSGALNSLTLVDGKAQTSDDNRICIWLENIYY